MLWLLPFILVGALVYWYFNVYKKKKEGDDTAKPADVQATVVQTAVKAAADNPELVAKGVAAAAGPASGPPPSGS